MSDSDKTNILIVDDLAENRLVYRSVLEELGEHLVAVPSGAAALEQVLKRDFAVILLDVNMPDINGFETARFIRQRRRSAHCPIIFLTAFTDEIRTTEAYETGGVDYISTPVVPEILRAKVRVFVELFRMRQQVAQQAEERAQRAAAEESARRYVFLAEASRALATSLDFEATLDRLGHLTVPHLADLSLVTLADEQGRPTGGYAAWNELERGVVRRPAGLLEPQPWLAAMIERVLASGKLETTPRLEPQLPLEGLLVDRGEDETEAGFPDLPVESVVVLPLAARGRTLGTLTLAAGSGSGRFQPADVSLADELACRAGIALDNALLFRNIQENDQRKNEFLAMLSHELRNPLAPIRNAVELMRRCPTDDPELKWSQEVIDRQVTHLARLVDDLLDVSRITRGKIQLLPESLDVAGVVQSAVETSRPLIEAHSHELTVSLPKGPLRVRGDAARLAQVLSNLLNNAAKYTPDGGRISLTVEKASEKASGGRGQASGGRQSPDEVVFRVRDTGAGIPRDMLSKIFDLFTQLDCSLDRSQGGLGIGLTLVRYLVEMHQGTVQAFSEGPGRGSEFVVRLPLHADQRLDPAASADAPSTGEAHGHACRVLVVDDNVDAAKSLAMLLRMNGHLVREAHDGPAALEEAGTFQPEVVLLDIGLPGLDGYEVARRLRAKPHTRNVLLVAVSGYGQDEDRDCSQSAGFDHHLTKPVDFRALQRLLPGANADRDSRPHLSVVG